MPLPLIIGIAAGIAGVAGVGSGIGGAVKMKDANDTMKSAKLKMENSQEKYEKTNKKTNEIMDELGKTELSIMTSFEKFSNLFEKIHNRPDFKKISNDNSLPDISLSELKEISVGAGVLLGGLGGAVAGTAGGFAAAGATTAAVMAIGTASTGTAISSLSGVAATNAALAALGGGSLAAGGGGMALGTAVLGGATLGVGLLVGGVIFNITGSKLSDKADEAWSQAKKTEDNVNKICDHLNKLYEIAKDYIPLLNSLQQKYFTNLGAMDYIINTLYKTDWNKYNEQEQLTVQNTVLLVQLLYKMCKVKFVEKSNKEGEIGEINTSDIDDAKKSAHSFLGNAA